MPQIPLSRCAPIGFTIFLMACGVNREDTPTPHSPEDILDTAIIAVTDYRTGAISVADLGGMTASDPVTLTHSDAVLRAWGERAIVINRFGGDNLQLLNPDTGFTTETQFSVGNGTNPHDVAIDGAGRALVTLYDAPHLGIFDLSTGEELNRVDLSLLADSDGLPEADAITRLGDRAYISLQRLNRQGGWTVEDHSAIAVLDLNTDTLIDMDPDQEGLQAIPLPFPAPTDRLLPLPDGSLLLVTTGSYTTTGDGALLRLDPRDPFDIQVLLGEEALGGSANYIASVDGERIFLVANILREEGQFDSDTALFAFDVASGNLQELLRTEGYALTDIAIDGEHRLLVSDRTATNPGIWVFDTQALSPIGTGFIPLPLPPFSIGVFGSPSETLQ